MESDGSSYWEEPARVESFASREPDVRLRAWAEEVERPAAVRCLDLGCAGGRNTEFLADRGFEVYAIDGSKAMVEKTRSRLAGFLRPAEIENRVFHCRMDELGWADDDDFSLIVAFGIFQNASSREEWDRSLDEVKRVLAPGGELLVSVFTPGTRWSDEPLERIAGERHVFATPGVGGRRAFLVSAETLDDEMAERQLVPVVATSTVRRSTENGERVTANGHYRKL